MEDNAWLQRDATAYDITLMRALVKREVHDKRALKNLMKSMAFGDKSSGCTLCEDFAPLDLKKGCRLIEAGEVVDVHDLMSIELPAVFTFFDTNINMGLNVVCPLFIIKGFTVQRVHLDSMHTLDLGVSQFVIGHVFRTMVRKNFARSRRRLANLRHKDN
eukprot:9500626-Pyramimonas_sp.AAC.1